MNSRNSASGTAQSAQFPTGVPAGVQPGQMPAAGSARVQLGQMVAGVPAGVQPGQMVAASPLRVRPGHVRAGVLMKKTSGGTTADPSGSPAKKKPTANDYAVSLLIKLGITAAALLILLIFFIGIFVCHENSSYPMIKDGDLCLTSRLSALSQGDEIAYKAEDGRIRFGRVVALEGDSIEISDDSITVNGYGIYENAVYPTTAEGASISFPYTVPDGCVFILNDYRSDISDSRTLGAIPVSRIKGKVFMVMRRRGI